MTFGALTLTAEVCRLLDDLDIPHVVGGSIASSIVGEPRATIDVDIAIRVDAAGVDALVGAFGDDWYVSHDAGREALARRTSFNIIHLASMQKVDLFVLGDGVLDRNQLARRQRVAVGSDLCLWIGSPEDQVLRKLWWFRLGGGVSERQWSDVVAILRIQADRLDDAYLDTTAAEVGLGSMLRRARQEARS